MREEGDRMRKGEPERRRKKDEIQGKSALGYIKDKDSERGLLLLRNL